MSRRKRLCATPVLVLAALATPIAYAQRTPDGLPPANEGVCDGLQSATPGLYGLCVAFCEAQDHSDSSTPISSEELDTLKDRAPSGRILKNYNKKKQDWDPDMPCIKVEEPCPCWDRTEFDMATTPIGGDNAESCVYWKGPVHNGSQILFEKIVSPRELRQVRVVDQRGHDATCTYRFRRPGAVDIERIFPLTVDQLIDCDAQIRRRTDDLGMVCVASN